MCLLVVAHRVAAETPLLLAANRDEFMDRPTRALHRWSDGSGIVAGRDLQAYVGRVNVEQCPQEQEQEIVNCRHRTGTDRRAGNWWSRH